MPKTNSQQTEIKKIVEPMRAICYIKGMPVLVARRRHRGRRLLLALLVVLGVYLLLAYIVLPAAWSHYEHHPALAEAPRTTAAPDGIPGDPLNVGLTGSRTEVIRAMLAAGWSPADPVTWRSSLEIADSVLLDRPYRDAPVSTLLLYGRKQDLAFEREQGASASQRHHVRFWLAPQRGVDGRDLWLGAVTFDRSVGLSFTTGQITHHIAPDIDAERDALVEDLERAGQVTRVYQVTGVGATTRGYNGGGDWYYSDGELTVALLAPGNVAQTNDPVQEPNPPLVAAKNTLWHALRVLLP